MLYPLLTALLCLLVAVAPAQTGPSDSQDIDAQALRIAGTSASPLERTQRLVNWINTNFAWSATDYQQRTAEQIIVRRAGNCAELSRVLARLLPAAGVRFRWVAEINIQPASPDRQERAAQLVRTRGPRASVFGLRHNDHRWLEIFDDQSNAWIPADPSVGVVGVNSWIDFRMGLFDRPRPAVPAVADVVKDMLVPIAVVVVSSADRPAEDRSDFYLVEEFNRRYGGKLSALPSWTAWTAGVRKLAPVVADAFAGRANLHDHAPEIEALGVTYESLRREAMSRGATAVVPPPDVK